jgi:hypothetical protein
MPLKVTRGVGLKVTGASETCTSMREIMPGKPVTVRQTRLCREAQAGPGLYFRAGRRGTLTLPSQPPPSTVTVFPPLPIRCKHAADSGSSSSSSSSSSKLRLRLRLRSFELNAPTWDRDESLLNRSVAPIRVDTAGKGL